MTSKAALKPGDGFYQYVNHAWIKKAKIPDSNSEYGAFDEVKVENDKKIWSVLEATEEKAPSAGEVAKTHKDHLAFYKYIWNKSKHSTEEQFVKGIIGQFLSSCNEREIARMVGWCCGSMMNTIIDIDVEEEERKPFYMRNTLSPGRLTLPVRYYGNKSLHSDSIWISYLSYIKTCAVELGLPFLHKAIEAETELADIIGTPTDEDAFKEFYGETLRHWLPDLFWDEFLEGAGLHDHWKQHKWILQDHICLKRLLKWLCTAESESVAAVMSLHLLNRTSSYLRPAIAKASFNLFRRSTLGEKTLPSEKERFIDDVSDSLPDILCDEFSKIEFDEKKLAYITDMTHRIKDAAVETMRENDILTNRTTSQTVEKINRMKVTIGSPRSDKNATERSYYPSLLETKFSLYKSKIKDMLKRVGRPVDREIEYPCFVVNASYYEEKNHFIIPWGILQPPFFIEDRGLGWNYGGTGSTIGHELTHAFDAEGSQYNARGKVRRWWTRKNREHFQARTKKMIKFFNQFMHCGRHLDGEKTLSENWADFGGLLLSLRALKKHLASMNATESEVKKEIRDFFISYAVSWRDRVRRQAILVKMSKSVHSLAEDRVDRIVPHFQEWVDLFNVKETDALFVKEKDRLKFF